MEWHEELHERADERIERLDERLWAVATALHERPELSYEEHAAAERLTTELAADGFEIETGVGGLPTAFVARAGTGRPCVALLLEYDALPGLGHACGHNLIAAAGLGAALAAKEILADSPGSLLAVGCPAEERGGGKVALAEAGVFDDVDAALTVHPGVHSWSWAPLTAQVELKVTFHGRAAHPAGDPGQGVDALAALIQAFGAVAALRQRLPASSHVQGIITHGGEATNIVPDRAEGRFGLRALTTAALDRLAEDVGACAEGAALATGAKVDVERLGRGFAHFRDNPVLSERFTEHLAARGIHATPPAPGVYPGSSDIGDVSVRVPTIHPFVAIAAEEHAVHTEEFAAASAGERGRSAMLASAAALARTAIDLRTHPALVSRAWDYFRAMERNGR
ncbi:N-acyl-L-amino acid amidohydrolase (EC [Amycolatopsis camponoti]|uniref:Peptidase M20 domain-containing protein 2 n=1 Tax=Amycolatopsis camponoti TaxID=2606593 RepID=A0A6I8LNU0_9PSEU|nr:amidohydrolase [Amycolatopsis camponoti]VVJ18672.1 N-acyl-L-amino acid amidohydrolase (EC [Amycolatopsis camponoti]